MNLNGIGYDYYPVNQTTGSLGKLKSLFYGQTLECTSSCAVAISSPVSAYSGVCCGPGSGSVVIAHTTGTQYFACEFQLAFCSDDVAGLYLDPLGMNVVFGDATTRETFIGHIDFSTSQLIGTSTSIPETPVVYFSPDARLLYGVNPGVIWIYAFQATTGDLTASTAVADSGNVSIATATLK